MPCHLYVGNYEYKVITNTCLPGEQEEAKEPQRCQDDQGYEVGKGDRARVSHHVILSVVEMSVENRYNCSSDPTKMNTCPSAVTYQQSCTVYLQNVSSNEEWEEHFDTRIFAIAPKTEAPRANNSPV